MEKDTGAVARLTDLVLMTELEEDLLVLTFGGYPSRERARLRYGAENYYRFRSAFEEGDDKGEVVDASALVSAWFGGSLDAEGRLTMRLQYDMMSGNVLEDADPAVPGGWLVPSQDPYSYFGHMNLFRSALDSAGLGVRDLQLRALWEPTERWELGLDGHQLWAFDGGDPLGFELDSRARFYVSPQASFEFAYMNWLPQSGATLLPAASDRLVFGYLQMVIAM